MRQFNVLPTDPLLQQMSLQQRNFVIACMNNDAQEMEDSANGISHENGSRYVDNDTSWLESSESEFENMNLLPGDMSKADFLKQMEDRVGLARIKAENEAFERETSSMAIKRASKHKDAEALEHDNLKQIKEIIKKRQNLSS